MPPPLSQSFLFSSSLFCCCSYLTCYTSFSPNALKGKGWLFFLSLLCLPHKCRNEHYIWNIVKRTLWWFSVLHLCKHFVFSPAGNQLPLLDLLSLILSECSCFCCRRSETGAFESICFTLFYFLQSHITSELILIAFCKQLLPPLGASADFFLLSLWREWGFAWELYLVSEVTQRLYLQLKRTSKGLWGTMPGVRQWLQNNPKEPESRESPGWHLSGSPLWVRTSWPTLLCLSDHSRYLLHEFL